MEVGWFVVDMFCKALYTRLVFTLFLVCSSSLFAGPWLYQTPYSGESMMAIKSDVDLLVSYGFIKTPVTTWPIAWVNIGPPLLTDDAKKKIKTSPRAVQLAYQRILVKYNAASSEALEGSAYASGGSKINPFRTFEWQPRSDAEGGFALEKQNSKVAANLALNYGKYDDLTHDVHLDNSYLYLFLGNWAVGVDKMNRWWGPGYSDSMILSNNPPPLPTLTLQRMKAEAFESKWLRWIGPWTLTTSLSVGGNDVPESHPLIWLTNLSLRPFESLQVSVSRVAFFAGETRPVNSRMLWNLAIVNDNCDSTRDGREYCDKYSPGTEHWEMTLDWDMYQALNVPANLYLQTIYNDRVPHSSAPWLYPGFRPPVPGRTAFLAGANTWFSINNALVRLYAEFEYTYQYVYYFWGQFAHNIYGYSIYPYSYKGKLLGSPLGGEAMGYTLGGVINEENGTSDTFSVRYLRLNEDSYRGYGYPFLKQKALWFSVGKAFTLPHNLGQLSGQLGYLKSVEGQGLKSAASGFVVWSRRL